MLGCDSGCAVSAALGTWTALILASSLPACLQVVSNQLAGMTAEGQQLAEQAKLASTRQHYAEQLAKAREADAAELRTAYEALAHEGQRLQQNLTELTRELQARDAGGQGAVPGWEEFGWADIRTHSCPATPPRHVPEHVLWTACSGAAPACLHTCLHSCAARLPALLQSWPAGRRRWPPCTRRSAARRARSTCTFPICRWGLPRACAAGMSGCLGALGAGLQGLLVGAWCRGCQYRAWLQGSARGFLHIPGCSSAQSWS